MTGTVNVVEIPRWFDRHLHIRDEEMMKRVLPFTLNQRATGAIIMPNLDDPISSIEKAKAYRDRITALLNGHDFVPCMTLYLTDHVKPEEVRRGFEEGIWRAGKLYMADQKGQGGTTGSSHGVKDLRGRYPVFAEMERCGMPLLGHFEAVEEDVDEFDREIVSIERDLQPIIDNFQGLKIVVEHLTDGHAADFVAHARHNVYATVTAHHLGMNRNGMFRGGMNPGHYCRPVAKREEHRQRVRSYVTTGHRRFGAGTDSAPHPESRKTRCYGCAAGIFTAPAAVEMYTTVFDEDNALDNLGAFLSENFLDVYGMTVSDEKMRIERTPLQVPDSVGVVRVFKGGETLPWKLVD